MEAPFVFLFMVMQNRLQRAQKGSIVPSISEVGAGTACVIKHYAKHLAASTEKLNRAKHFGDGCRHCLP